MITPANLAERERHVPQTASRADYFSTLLGPVDVHLRRITVATMAMNALQLVSVLQQRMAIPLYSLSFPKKFPIR
jgi:hypothetical protein